MKTDLVMGYRNFARWKNLIKVGNVLGNLKLKDENTIDADSRPILINGNKPMAQEQSIKELTKLGVFG